MRPRLLVLLTLVLILAWILPMCLEPTTAQEPRNLEQQPFEEIAAFSPALTIELVGDFDTAMLPSAVAVQGGYAYVGVGQRLAVLTVSSPNHPAFVGQTAPFSDAVQSVAVVGMFAYVAAGGAGLRVIDVSAPGLPVETGFCDTAGPATDIAISGTYAYVTTDQSGLEVIDISNPAAPLLVGSCDTPGSAAKVVVSGSHAYVVDVPAGLRVIDIANPDTPQEVGSFNTPCLTDVFVAGSYAYVTLAGSSAPALQIVDISDPASPYKVGALTQDPFNYMQAYGVAVVGGYAYLAAETDMGGEGLRTIDVSIATDPRQVDVWWGTMFYDVTVSGRHAYAISSAGLYVFDITNAMGPAAIGTYGTIGGTVDFSLAFPYAYLIKRTEWEWDTGLQIVDLSDPTSPRQSGFLDLPSSAQDISVAGSHAFVAADFNGLRVLDVSDPTSPLEVGRFDALSLTLGVSAADDYAYVIAGIEPLAGNPEWLKVLDVSDPSAPQEVGSMELLDGARDLAVAGPYAYIVAGQAGVQIVDISDPAAPRGVAVYDTPGFAEDVVISGSLAYVADYTTGLRILDISSPATPHEVGAYDTPNLARSVSVMGTVAYVADRDTIRAIDVSDPASPVEIGVYGPLDEASSIAASPPYICAADWLRGFLILWAAPTAKSRISPSGGSLVSQVDRTTYTFPAGAFSDTVTVTHVPRFLGNVPSADRGVAMGHTFEVTATYCGTGESAWLTQPYTITIEYTNEERGSVVESTLGLYFWNGSAWELEPTSHIDPEQNRITATPAHLSLWQVQGQAHRVYLPLLWRGLLQANMDLEISGVEVTQAVQNPENGVSLVASRPAVVRVYAQTSGSMPLNDTYLSLAGSRDGTLLPGSPLLLGPWAVFHTPLRSLYGNSFNVLLPPEWLSGTVKLVATVDPANEIPETNEQNNTTAVTLTFDVLPPLKLKIVPVNYTDTVTGQFYPAPTRDTISDWIVRAYPLSAVNVSFRTPVNFAGNLATDGQEWSRLLQQVSDVKQADGAPASQEYYGFLPLSNEAGSWSPQVVSGMGYLGGRVAVGTDWSPQIGSPVACEDDLSGQLAAHEIGHNFGRNHPTEDPNYPYANSRIGQYALDVSRDLLLGPSESDLMCAVDCTGFFPWFSDYTYQGLFEDQRQHGTQRQALPLEALLVRVRFDGAGQPSILPTYVASVIPDDLPDSDAYILELLDGAGRLVATHPIPSVTAREGNLHIQSINATVPMPSGPVATVRLRHAGQVIAERPLVQPAPGLHAIPLVEQSAGQITLRWGAPEVPALVRYTVDDGRTWTTVGLDVLGGELHLDPQTLPGGAGRFEIVLADTVPPIVRTVDIPTTLPDTIPQAWITGPTTASAGRPLILFGHGTDREDGALTDLHWAVDGREIQAGQVLQLDSLTPGEHSVVLTVFDRGGHSAQAEHTVLVLP